MSAIPVPPAVPTAPRRRGWPLERVLFAIAGSVTLASVTLAVTVSPWFLVLAAFAGANQLLFVVAGACPASFVLRRLFGVESCDRTAGA